jgi:hypothetical protein
VQTNVTTLVNPPSNINTTNITATSFTANWSDINIDGPNSPTYLMRLTSAFGPGSCFTILTNCSFNNGQVYSGVTYTYTLSETLNGVTSATTAPVSVTTGIANPTISNTSRFLGGFIYDNISFTLNEQNNFPPGSTINYTIVATNPGEGIKNYPLLVNNLSSQTITLTNFAIAGSVGVLITEAVSNPTLGWSNRFVGAASATF